MTIKTDALTFLLRLTFPIEKKENSLQKGKGKDMVS